MIYQNLSNSTTSMGGLMSYPNGHSFPLEFVRLISDKTAVGRLPITDMLVHWFIGVQQGTGTSDPTTYKMHSQSNRWNILM